MGKSLCVIRIVESQPAFISGDEVALFGSHNASSTELWSQVSAPEAMTFSKLRANIISGGSGQNDFRFRKNTANGNQLASITGTGIAEDTTNSDTLAANDVFNLAYVDTGTDSRTSWISALVEFASGHGSVIGCARASSAVWDVPSATQFACVTGGLNTDGAASETVCQWKNRGWTSWESLQIRVTVNARTNATQFRSRVNGANGAKLIEYAAGATGLVTDTDVDTLADGDLISISGTLDTGVEDIQITLMCSTMKSTSNKSDMMAQTTGDQTRAASATPTYIPIGGAMSASTLTEAQARIKVGFAATVSNLRMQLSANTYTSDATVKLYKNGVEAIAHTITAGATGWRENSTDTVTIDEDDELSLELDEGGTGSITFHSIGFTFSPIATASQLLSPFQDISAGGWFPSSGSPAELWDMIDGTDSPDMDYAYTLTPGTMEVKFSPGNNPSTEGGTLRYRLTGFNGTTDAIVRLKQGNTVLAEWTHTNVPSADTAYSQTLTVSPSISLTDATDLRLSVEAV